MLDFAHKEDSDLDLSGGDISWGESTKQHQVDIILTTPGALKHAPARGVGVTDFVNDEGSERLLRKTRQEMVKDGIKVNSIAKDSDTGKLEINGYYESDYNG